VCQSVTNFAAGDGEPGGQVAAGRQRLPGPEPAVQDHRADLAVDLAGEVAPAVQPHVQIHRAFLLRRPHPGPAE
jgi:hypothetical protein